MNKICHTSKVYKEHRSLAHKSVVHLKLSDHSKPTSQMLKKDPTKLITEANIINYSCYSLDLKRKKQQKFIRRVNGAKNVMFELLIFWDFSFWNSSIVWTAYESPVHCIQCAPGPHLLIYFQTKVIWFRCFKTTLSKWEAGAKGMFTAQSLLLFWIWTL